MDIKVSTEKGTHFFYLTPGSVLKGWKASGINNPGKYGKGAWDYWFQLPSGENYYVNNRGMVYSRWEKDPENPYHSIGDEIPVDPSPSIPWETEGNPPSIVSSIAAAMFGVKA